MIPRGSESRVGTPITLIAVHTSEGATTTASLASYLDQPGVEASYHVLVDDNGVYRYLPDEPAAWAMLSGNHRSVQVCLTGFARWPRSEWLAHDNMLRSAAAVVRTWCTTYNIPNVKLTPAQVGADQHGICGHWDWTLGKHDGTHTDPGPFFPWDVFIQYVNLAPGPQPPPPSPGPGSIPLMNYGETSAVISHLQDWLNRVFPSYSHISPVTGYYGDQTTGVVKEFQRRVGIVGADGRNVGVQTRAKLFEHGFRG
jgi:N-acetyl-anhydromuramyl-L-alanine amidase AmpD